MKPITELTDEQCMELIRTSTAGGTYALTQANRRIAELERKNAELEEKFENLDEEYEGAKVHIRQLEAENAALEKQFDRLDDEYAGAREHVRRLARENAELRNERGALRESADREIHDLHVECMELQRTVESLERQLAQADDMVIELEERLAATT